jgi:hypothetical protein
MLLTWRYAHALRRPLADAGTAYDEPVGAAHAAEPGVPRRGQTVVPRFSHTSPTSMPTF